jgi:hypothetical protein
VDNPHLPDTSQPDGSQPDGSRPGSNGAWATPDSGAATAERKWVAPETGSDRPGAAPRPVVEPPSETSAVRLPVPLRPMTMSDLLDGAFAIIKSRPGAVFGVTAAIIIPFHLFQAWLSRNLVSGSTFSALLDQPTTRSRTNAAQQNADVFTAYLGIAIGTLAIFLVGCAVAKLVSSWYAGGDATAGEALLATWKAIPGVVAVWVLALIPLAVSLAFCGVGWFFLDPLLIVVAPVLVIERIGPIAAVRRSFTLVGRRYMPVVGANALATVMALIAAQVLTLLPQFIAGVIGAPWNWVVLGVGQSLASLLLVPAVAGVAVLIYLDLRVRTEGLDIELQVTDTFASST